MGFKSIILSKQNILQGFFFFLFFFSLSFKQLCKLSRRNGSQRAFPRKAKRGDVGGGQRGEHLIKNTLSSSSEAEGGGYPAAERMCTPDSQPWA